MFVIFFVEVESVRKKKKNKNSNQIKTKLLKCEMGKKNTVKFRNRKNDYIIIYTRNDNKIADQL